MRNKFLPIILLLALFMVVSGCGQPKASSKDFTAPKQKEKTTLSASEVLAGLKAAKLPIGQSTEYTAETDTNNLLGRPGQYIGKINFEDTRIEEDNADLNDSIEVFSNTNDLNSRANYIKAVTKDTPMLLQYSYTHKNVLLRLDTALTPDQAAEYEKALKSL